MSADIVILVPVLGRPQNVAPLLESIRAAGDHRTLFIVSPHDREEREAITREGGLYVDAPFEVGPGDYARKINYAAHGLKDHVWEWDWILTGADDLRFHPGWAEAALRVAHEEFRAAVIGTNDLANPRVMKGKHATHSLVSRHYIEAYGTVDEPGKVLHEGYPHEFVDDELVETAKWRGMWAFARDSHVEHMHPHFRPEIPTDDLYDQFDERMMRGRRIFRQRQRLWSF